MRKKLILRKRIAQMVSDIEILPSDVIPGLNHHWRQEHQTCFGWEWYE